MYATKVLLAALAALPAAVGDPAAAKVGGNYYDEEVSAITFTNFGVGGQYSEATDVSCVKKAHPFDKAPSAPLDEEVTIAIRGPIRLKQFAAYAPGAATTRNKRDSNARHGHQHAHLHKENKRAVQTITYMDNGQLATMTADTAGWGGGAPAQAPAPAPVQAKANIANVAQPAASSSSSDDTDDTAPSTDSSGDWTQIGSYTASGPKSKGITFLKAAAYQPVTFQDKTGKSTASSPTALDDVLVPSNEEFTIWTDKECGDTGCGYVGAAMSKPYHGFTGGAKAFLFEFSMPEDTPAIKGKNDNMPSIWLLNSKIPRVDQYSACNCHDSGCGELDLFEVLSTAKSGELDAANMMTCSLHSNQPLTPPNYFKRPTGTPVKGAVVMEDYKVTIALLPDDFEIGSTLTKKQRSSVSAVQPSFETKLPEAGVPG